MKIGDIVVCVNTLYVSDCGAKYEDTLILGKKYVILNIETDERFSRDFGDIQVMNEYGIKYYYSPNNFRLLSDIRGNIIDDLLS